MKTASFNPAHLIWASALGLSLMLGGWVLLPGWSETFRDAEPHYSFRFPNDHAAHPDFMTEWWYYTGHLLSEDNRRYGYELTFFRVGLEPEPDEDPAKPPTAWEARTVYATHFAVTDEHNHTFHYSEKLNRPGFGVAGARSDVYYVWNELWFAELLGGRHVLHAESDEFALHLMLTPQKPPVIHGLPGEGISRKADCPGCASHYYSLTRLETEGLLFEKNTPDSTARRVRGLSWMDHEFGSNQLTETQVGWDWFSLQLDNNTELMLYLLRHEDGTLDPNSSGTLVEADGQSRHLGLDEFSVTPTGQWRSPETRATYPMGWRIEVPDENITLSVDPVIPDQELVTAGSTRIIYWEGSSRVRGRMREQVVTGQGYVELTGYAEPFRQRI